KGQETFEVEFKSQTLQPMLSLFHCNVFVFIERFCLNEKAKVGRAHVLMKFCCLKDDKSIESILAVRIPRPV
ncbi:hypothetical protein RFZ33_13740, partial [Acinetobacter baumannii]|nr:hypothetical protein [Acinetobacter baumannii]